MSDAVRQISDLMSRYAELSATGRFDEFAALSEHENVRLHDGRTRTGHVTTNVVVEVVEVVEDAGTGFVGWFHPSGAAVAGRALSDPLWARTSDLADEAEAAALARAR